MGHDPAARLARAVLALDGAALARVLDALAAAAEVAAAGYRVTRRTARGERFAERNARIRADHARNLTPGQIAAKEGMSRDAVRQVLRRGRAGYAPPMYPLATAGDLKSFK